MAALRQRVVTAGVLIALVLVGVTVLPSTYFSLLVAIVALMGAWEWAGLCGWNSRRARSIYVVLFALGLLATYRLLVWPGGLAVILAGALTWWLAALVLVWYYQHGGRLMAVSPWLRALVGWLVLIPTWVALSALHAQPDVGPYLVLFLLGLIWCADTVAFFVGRRWGATRLASRVSPGKSLEGAAGAMVAVLLMAFLAAGLLGITADDRMPFVVLALFTALMSILGDLAESVFKRLAGVKDSGRLLPGHGGILDRIDSLTAAAPLFVGGVYVLGPAQ